MILYAAGVSEPRPAGLSAVRRMSDKENQLTEQPGQLKLEKHGEPSLEFVENAGEEFPSSVDSEKIPSALTAGESAEKSPGQAHDSVVVAETGKMPPAEDLPQTEPAATSAGPTFQGSPDSDSMSLGEYLRHHREAAGRSFEQLSATTRISVRVIQAVEEERFEETPSAPVVRGFLKLLAEEIGVRPADLLSRFDVAGVKEEEVQVFPDWCNQLKSPRSRFGGWAPAAAFILLVLGISYFYITDSWSPGPNKTVQSPEEDKAKKASDPVVPETLGVEVAMKTEPGSPASPPSSERPAETERVKNQDGGVIDRASAETQRSIDAPVSPETKLPGQPEKAEVSGMNGANFRETAEDSKVRMSLNRGTTASSPLMLNITAKEDTWLRVIVDGKQRDEIFLLEGESRKWQGDKIFVLTIGNAASTRVELNGSSIKLPQTESNFVHDFLISKNNLP